MNIRPNTAVAVMVDEPVIHTDPKTGLIALPAQNALDFFTKDDGVDPILAHIRKELDAFTPDVTTKKGRSAITSLAYKVSQTKTALDGVGKALADEQKEIPKKIDAARKKIRDTLDGWRDDVRKPLDEWEAADEKRIEAHRATIKTIMGLTARMDDAGNFLSSAQLHENLGKVRAYVVDEATCQEFLPDYEAAVSSASDSLGARIAERVIWEQQQEELAKLRAEKAEREAREAAERAAREEEERKAAAEKAEADRKAAAELAERERIEAAKKEAAEAAVRAERERIEAEHRAAEEAAQAERDRVEQERIAKEAEAKAERDRIEAEAAEALRIEREKHEAERVEAEKREAALKAETERLEAEKREAEQARLYEQEQAERHAKAMEEMRLARAADEVNRLTVTSLITDAFVAGGMSRPGAVLAAALVIGGTIPHVTVNF